MFFGHLSRDRQISRDIETKYEINENEMNKNEIELRVPTESHH